MNNFSEKIISWYEINGRKIVTKKILTKSGSETCFSKLKYTIPYFNKFISKYPTIKTLASTSLDEVLSSWSDLSTTQGQEIFIKAKILKKILTVNFLTKLKL